MKNFKDAFKNKARSKSLSSEDMVAYCILKAMAAKHENKQELADFFIRKAFTPGKLAPHRHHRYQALHGAVNGMISTLRWRKVVIGIIDTDLFESGEELELFKSLAESYKTFG